MTTSTTTTQPTSTTSTHQKKNTRTVNKNLLDPQPLRLRHLRSTCPQADGDVSASFPQETGLHCFTDATSDTLHRIGSLRPFPYYSNSRFRGVVWPDQFTPTIQSANTLNCMHQKHAIHPFTIPSAIHAYGHLLRHQQFTLMTFTRLRSSSSTTYDPSRLSPASASYPTIYGGVSSAPRVRATTMEDQAPDSAGDRC